MIILTWFSKIFVPLLLFSCALDKDESSLCIGRFRIFLNLDASPLDYTFLQLVMIIFPYPLFGLRKRNDHLRTSVIFLSVPEQPVCRHGAIALAGRPIAPDNALLQNMSTGSPRVITSTSCLERTSPKAKYTSRRKTSMTPLLGDPLESRVSSLFRPLLFASKS